MRQAMDRQRRASTSPDLGPGHDAEQRFRERRDARRRRATGRTATSAGESSGRRSTGRASAGARDGCAYARHRRPAASGERSTAVAASATPPTVPRRAAGPPPTPRRRSTAQHRRPTDGGDASSASPPLPLRAARAARPDRLAPRRPRCRDRRRRADRRRRVLMRAAPTGARRRRRARRRAARRRVLLLADRRSIGRGVAADRRPPRVAPRRAGGTATARPRRRPEPRWTTDGRPEPVASRCPTSPRGLELLAAPFRGETVGVIKDRTRAHVHGGARGQGRRRSGSSTAPSRRRDRPAGAACSPASPARAARSAGSSGSSGPCRPTATRSAATSARPGIATPSRSTRSRCSPTSTSSSSAPAVTKDHELFVCLQIDAKRAWRQIKRAGGKRRTRRRRLRRAAARARGARRAARRRRRPGRRRAPARDARERDPGRLRPVVATRASRASPPPTPSATASTRRAAWPVGAETSLGLLPDRRRVPRDLLDRELAAHRRRRRLPLAAAPARADGARDRGHDRAGLAAEGDPRGRGRADDATLADRELRGRMGFVETARRRRVSRGDRPPRGGARRRSRRRALRRLRHRLRPHVGGARPRTAPRSSTPRRWRGSSSLRLYGQQEEAFTYTLPLCRGLR